MAYKFLYRLVYSALTISIVLILHATHTSKSSSDTEGKKQKPDDPDQYFQVWSDYALPDNTTVVLPAIPPAARALRPFRPFMTRGEQAVMYAILAAVDAACAAANVTCVICDGTLIGSYRHHALVPWDDDADVFFVADDRDALVAAINGGPGDFTAVAENRVGDVLKVYSETRSVRNSGLAWKWPFVDLIGHHWLNATHLTGPTSTGSDKAAIPRDVIWPPRRRPLGPLTVAAPARGLQYLQIWYGTEWATRCLTHYLSHKWGRRKRFLFPGWARDQFLGDTACAELRPYYPFVTRDGDGEDAAETLEVPLPPG